MNEVGLDPGIDHMLAMQCFDEIRQLGGKVCALHHLLVEEAREKSNSSPLWLWSWPSGCGCGPGHLAVVVGLAILL